MNWDQEDQPLPGMPAFPDSIYYHWQDPSFWPQEPPC